MFRLQECLIWKIFARLLDKLGKKLLYFWYQKNWNNDSLIMAGITMKKQIW